MKKYFFLLYILFFVAINSHGALSGWQNRRKVYIYNATSTLNNYPAEVLIISSSPYSGALTEKFYALWRLDDDSDNNIVSEYYNKYSGTCPTNTSIISTTTAMVGRAYNFTVGVSSFVTLPYNDPEWLPSKDTSHFSIAFWVKFKTTVSADNEWLISLDGAASSDPGKSSGIYIRRMATEKIRFDVSTNNEAADGLTTTVFNDTDWHHVALAVHYNAYDIYVDGNYESTVSYTGTIQYDGSWSSDKSFFGKHVRSDGFEGINPAGFILDEVIISSITFKPSDIEELYNLDNVEYNFADLSKFKSDFDDVRFTTNSGSLLDSWLLTTSTYSCKAMVNSNYPANSTTTLYMYYNNPDANDSSDGDAVFNYFDDFEKGVGVLTYNKTFYKPEDRFELTFQSVVGTMGTTPGVALIWYESDRQDGKVYSYAGEDNSLLWTYVDRGTNPVSMSIGDVDGDGVNEIAVGAHDRHSGVTLISSSDASEIWYYANPISTAGRVIRTVAIGEVDKAIDGLETFWSDRFGECGLIDKDGNNIWHNDYGSKFQTSVIADLDEDGQNEIVGSGGSIIVISSAGVVLNSIVKVECYGLAVADIRDDYVGKEIAYATGRTNTYFGLLDKDLNEIWETTSSLKDNWHTEILDIDNDGELEIINAYGSNDQVAGNYYDWGGCRIYDAFGNYEGEEHIPSSSKFMSYGDYNNNGNIELFLSCDDDNFYVYEAGAYNDMKWFAVSDNTDTIVMETTKIIHEKGCGKFTDSSLSYSEISYSSFTAQTNNFTFYMDIALYQKDENITFGLYDTAISSMNAVVEILFKDDAKLYYKSSYTITELCDYSDTTYDYLRNWNTVQINGNFEDNTYDLTFGTITATNISFTGITETQIDRICLTGDSSARCYCFIDNILLFQQIEDIPTYSFGEEELVPVGVPIIMGSDQHGFRVLKKR